MRCKYVVDKCFGTESLCAQLCVCQALVGCGNTHLVILERHGSPKTSKCLRMLPSPAQVCVGCWKQCADTVCMCGLVLQSQLYMFRVHVVVGNLVGDTLGLLLRPCLSQQLTP